MTRNIDVQSAYSQPVGSREFEICEHKGIGHPDTLTDGVCEAASRALAQRYLREFGRAEGMAPDFGGPLAKPQRMALVTGGALLGMVWPAVLGWTLILLLAGTSLTAALRARRLRNGLLIHRVDRLPPEPPHQ